MKNVLIAGGSGMIGSELSNLLKEKGYTVKILSRKSSANFVSWSPEKIEIDSESVNDTEILINLSGTGIDEKRWTANRKKELVSSRIDTTNSLYALRENFPNLKQYISASGITAYGFDEGVIEHAETDNYGTDFLSQLVKQWEEAADQFSSIAKVVKLRIAVVLTEKGGALPKLMKPIKYGIGSPIGTGKQQMPWVHIDDLVRTFEHAIANDLYGVYNTNAGNSSNEELTKELAHQMKKPFWFPNIPGFILKIMFGEMSEMLLKGAKADNSKLVDSGYEFKYLKLEDALGELLK